MREPRSFGLWDIVCEYVKEKHHNVPVDPDNAIAGGYRFRIKVFKSKIEIIDSGFSPGMKAPEDFPRQVIPAADPDLFKKISKTCKYRGRGGVVVYRDKIRKLLSNWTMLAAPDLMAVHGLDLETELIDNMATEIKNEIDKEIIEDLTKPLDVGDVMPKPKKKRKK